MSDSKKVKAVNYTEAQMAVLSSGYTGGDNKAEVAALASELNRSAGSIRAKLANMGLYQKAEAVKAASTAKTTKAVKAAQVGKICGFTPVEMEAASKTTNAVLDKILARLTNGQ